MKSALTIIFCLAFTATGAGSGVDSLKLVWQDTALDDSVRVSAFSAYIQNGFLYSQPDSAYILAQELIEYSEENDNLLGQAIGLNLQGVSQDIRGNSTQALELHRRSLAISLELNDRNRIGVSLNNIGIIYEDQGDYLRALDYYEQCLDIYEDIGRKDGIARSLGNIGDIYRSHGNLDKALEYYSRCWDPPGIT